MTAPEPTPPLKEFLSQYAEDDNAWWRLSAGDMQNLFDELLESMRVTTEALDACRERFRLLSEAMRNVVIELQLVEEDDA